MNKYISFPLTSLFVLSLFSLMVTFSDLKAAFTDAITFNNPFIKAVLSPFFWILSLFGGEIAITLAFGFLTVFVAVVVLVAALGLKAQVIGSTLAISEYSQEVIFKVLIYYAAFLMASAFALSPPYGLLAIPYGWLVFLILTIIYTFGITTETGFGKSGDKT